MLYPKNIESKIGFDRIRKYIEEECVSSLGASFVKKIKFLDDLHSVQKLLLQTEEFRKVLMGEDTFPASNFLDVRPQLKKAKIENTFLTEEEFFDLKVSLQTIFRCHDFFSDKEEEYPQLSNLRGLVEIDRKIVASIGSIIDERGKMRNNASALLQEIRKSIHHEQIRLRKVLDQVLRSAKNQGFTPDDVSLTIRSGRMVIPIQAEHKRRIKGFIHDESASGRTVFLEPAEVLEINNGIRELEYKEKREVLKILTVLTDQLRPVIPMLLKAYQFLGTLDFIRAKARFALKIDAVMPGLLKGNIIELFNARHPLLLLSHRAQGKEVVPLVITINDGQRIMVISGPNAGGKSVTLKTVALVQYMLQCGLLVPVEPHSRLGVFNNIFIDIGDEQSIENDLSTYSSHLKNMKYFTRFADNKTLFLIDEFGTGTDPQFGGAIAEAILQQLNLLKAYGVVTTHYTNLKKFAEKSPEVINAAMRFDLENLEPLYQLEMGKPGSSFALEIACKIGLPEVIIQQAKQNIGVEQVALDELLGELEVEKRKYDQKIRAVNKQESELQRSLSKYTEMKEFVDSNRKKLLDEAKEEAQRILNEANQKIEATIREIKEKKAEKTFTREVRAGLEKYKESMKPRKEEKETLKVISGEISVGDLVRLKGQDAIGEVLNVKGKNAEISIGSLKSHVKTNRLEKISVRESKRLEKGSGPSFSVKGLNMTQRRADFSGKLDIRGKRVEEALPEVEAFIDNAVILNFREIRILHGKGDGILRKVVRGHLKSSQFVKNMRDGHADRGGSGVTIVEL